MFAPKRLSPVAFTACIIALCILNIAKPAETPHEKKHHWSYIGETGPRDWGRLDVANHLCSLGKKQSPVDINDSVAKKNKGLPSLMISYLGIPLKILNNGHTIQVNYPKGSTIQIGNNKYDLLQFHFHTPS